MTTAPTTQVLRVAVDAPVMHALSYLAPDTQHLAAGTRVRVPLGRRLVNGVVLGEEPAPPRELKTIAQVLDDEAALPAEVLALCEFAASYYRAPPGELMRAALPPGLGHGAGPRLGLTRAGRALLRSALLSGLDDRSLAVLRSVQRGPRARRQLERTGTSPASIERLLAEGLIDQRTPQAAQAEADEEVFGMVASTEPPTLPPQARAMRAVCVLLADGRPRSRGEIEDAVPGGRDALPRLLRRGLVQRGSRQKFLPQPEALHLDEVLRPQLTPAQDEVVGILRTAIDARQHEAFLLHGVTSSGKTEVYLAAAEHVLAQGRSVLVLVPEIALTPQLVGRFVRRLDAPVEVLHSALPEAQRRQRWARVRSGRARCVVGARSAVFAPMQDLGLIVVDEEHDQSYKQDDSPRYHGRDLALWRAHHLGIPVLLGSATPSLESYQRTRQGSLHLLELPQRVGGAVLPEVRVVALTPERSRGADDGIEILTPALGEALEQALGRGEQAILFLNRRGFANFVLCLDCGEIVGCPHCSVSLTHHRARRLLLCHYCGHHAPVPEQCGRCQGVRVVPLGLGTERVEDAVRSRFPGVRIARIDRDTTRRRGALLDVLERFSAREIDVLVGTQMLAKGHDFPNVTVVGVVIADVGLAVADFRASERTFQLLSQVAGRAGRGRKPGLVVVQAFDAGHPAIQAAAAHDYPAFAEAELEQRRLLRYPPFGRLAVVRLEHRDESDAMQEARAMVRAAKAALPGDAELLGPAPAPLSRLRDVSRVQILVKAPGPSAMQRALQALRSAHERGAGRARLVFDVDPALVL
ncbi:MAG: primosomal protein N' [Pseudomonadota bacterium]